MEKDIDKTLEKDFKTHVFNTELGNENHIRLLTPYVIVPPNKYILPSFQSFKIYPSECMGKSFDYAEEMITRNIEGNICTGYWNPLYDYINKVYEDGEVKYTIQKSFHMWIEIENNTIAFDGVYQNFFTKEEYYILFGIIPVYKIPFETGLDQNYRELFKGKMCID